MQVLECNEMGECKIGGRERGCWGSKWQENKGKWGQTDFTIGFLSTNEW